MRCPRCNAANDAGARFCEDCGGRLDATCPSCGTPITPGKKFCRSCGAALTAEPAGSLANPESYIPKHLAEKILTSRSALEGERKQVTVLFADLKSSTELLADRDPEEARALLDPVLHHMMDAVHRYEGTVNQGGSTSARGSASRPASTSPSPRRCTARWTCDSGWSRRRRRRRGSPKLGNALPHFR